MIFNLESYQISLLFSSLQETIILVLLTSLISIPLGTIIGYIISMKDINGKPINNLLTRILSFIINIIRSIPFILIMVLITPLTFKYLGTSYGFIPSFTSLLLISIATVSRSVSQSITDVNPIINDLAHTLGATKVQTFIHFLFTESKSSLILGYTSSIISTLAYSTVVYMIGGGGLGYAAIAQGFYNPYGQGLMYAGTIVMIILVQLIQLTGSFLASKTNKKKRGTAK